MGKYLAVLVLLLCIQPSIHAQKARLGQVPKPIGGSIQAHIYASHIRNYCSDSAMMHPPVDCGYMLFVDAVLDGEKVELMGPTNIENRNLSVLIPGDYQADLTKDEESRDRTAVHQEYNIKMPDGTVWPGVLVGVSE
ncbi:MAG TPA: hypothetical protein VHD85_06850 [Terracidiphilus sp.]|nr:hypothetical protein [Terracidiphilus sp.]